MIKVRLTEAPRRTAAGRRYGGTLDPWLAALGVGDEVFATRLNPDCDGESFVQETEDRAARVGYLDAGILEVVAEEPEPAKAEVVERTVERVVTETKREVVLRLTEEEASFLYGLTGRSVVGSSSGPRGLSDAIYDALRSARVRMPAYYGSGSVQF